MASESGKMDRATVEYVARLSRIALSEEEKALFGDQLSNILEYIEQLNRLDTVQCRTACPGGGNPQRPARGRRLAVARALRGPCQRARKGRRFLQGPGGPRIGKGPRDGSLRPPRRLKSGSTWRQAGSPRARSPGLPRTHLRSTTRTSTRFSTSTPTGRSRIADAVDDKRASGEPLGALAGVPVALKDVLCTRGVPTTCGSKILESLHPALQRDCRPAPARRRRRSYRQDQHGRVRHGVLDGKLAPSARPPTPGTSRRIPGGSSGGSAAAVAARMAP